MCNLVAADWYTDENRLTTMLSVTVIAWVFTNNNFNGMLEVKISISFDNNRICYLVKSLSAPGMVYYAAKFWLAELQSSRHPKTMGNSR